MASLAARSRSPHRRPLASKLNALAVLSEDEELAPPKRAAPPPPPAPAPAPAPAAESPSRPTAADIADADAALARMEAELAARISAPPPPPPAGSPDSSDSSSSDEGGAPPRRAASWRKSVGRRGSGAGRRASLDHAMPAQRRALRRLSAILADGGAARRARERESGARRGEAAAARARADRAVAQRRTRLKSVAKMMDLALVWDWLEANGERGARPGHEGEGQDAEGFDESARLDAEALAVVREMAASAAEARGRELRLAENLGAPRGHRASVCRALRTLRSLATLAVRVDSYDAARGFYGVRVALPVGGGASRTIAVSRSWRDLLKLRRGLAKRLPTTCALPKLPRARPLSTLKRSVRNLAGAGRGDRKWHKSKLGAVDAWLRGTLGAVAREAQAQGRIDAEEFLEDFLFAYGTVADESA